MADAQDETNNIDYIDHIVSHIPKQAKKHEDIKLKLVKWEGYEKYYKQSPQLLNEDVPNLVKQYWESEETPKNPKKKQKDA